MNMFSMLAVNEARFIAMQKQVKISILYLMVKDKKRKHPEKNSVNIGLNFNTCRFGIFF